MLLCLLLGAVAIQLMLLHELGGHIVVSVVGELLAKNLMRISFPSKWLLKLLLLWMMILVLLLEVVKLVE